MRTIIGIDTGGTYTDAVVCDAATREILAEAKSLTTKHDLSLGIHRAIAALPSALTTDVECISLSTTLATNACVENRGGRAMLILFGTETATMDRYGSGLGRFSMSDLVCIETGTHMDGTIDREPDWDAFAEMIASKKELYDAFAVAELYALRTGARLEKRAREIITEVTGAPVVCGHELFTELNVLKRGVNALLNARLIPIIREFLDAVDRSLRELGIDAPVMIVRSDGTLMSAAFAATHPIETLLCGPAASALGAAHLTDVDRAVIADVGGTTSDVAFLDRNEPEEVSGSVRIGGWSTFLHGLFLETFALGGDTGVSYKPYRYMAENKTPPSADEAVTLKTRRVVPVCILASEHPEILPELRELEKYPAEDAFAFAYLVLQHGLTRPEEYTEREQRAIGLLAERPLTVRQLSARLGMNRHIFRPEHLLETGIVLSSGLTPTDVMHLRGDFGDYCTEASRLAAEYAARCMSVTPEELCDAVYDKARFRLFRNLAHILLEKDMPLVREGRRDTQLFDELLTAAFRQGQNTRHLRLSFSTELPLVGLGGPAAVFVPAVAKALGTTCIIPEHASVANAVGAALGHISFVATVRIEYIYGLTEQEKLAQKNKAAASRVRVIGRGLVEQFDIRREEEALEYARDLVRKEALLEAKERGIKDTPSLTERIKRYYYIGQAMPRETHVQLLVHD